MQQGETLPFAGAAIIGLASVLLPGPETDWALFVDSTPPLLEASARGDEEAVRKLAHTLKSSCDNVGATRMAAACRALEDPGSAHAPLVKELHAAYPATLEELRDAVVA